MRFIERGDEPVERFLFTLAQGEVETFRIYAVAEHCCCEWTARLSYLADGKRGFIEVSYSGDAFKTTGITNAERHTWYDGRWSTTFWADNG